MIQSMVEAERTLSQAEKAMTDTPITEPRYSSNAPERALIVLEAGPKG